MLLAFSYHMSVIYVALVNGATWKVICMLIMNAVQLLVADRLTEAREEALNGHVFRVVLDESQTRLVRETDLVPLTRRNGRTGIADDIAQNTTFPSTRSDLGVSLSRVSSQAPRSATHGLPNSPCKSVSGKPRSEGESSASPRIGTEDGRFARAAAQSAAEASAAADAHPVGAVRRRYYDRDGEDRLARLVSMHSGLPA